MKQDKMGQFIKKHHLLEKGSSIVVGVSGGADSIALLHYLWTLREKWSLTLIAAHVDHMFRGQESYEDLLFVKEFCESREILFEGTSIDVPAFAREYRLSAQEAARESRYNFYSRVMKKYSSHYLALAHHGDDQVETMLMRMVRGSYGQAVAGIPIKRSFNGGTIIRPFLCLTKMEIEKYIEKFNLSFRLDPSNEKDDYQRNRFRHHILPFLKTENPTVSEKFQNLSELLTEDHQLLEEYASMEIEKLLIEKTEKKVVFPINEFLMIPIPLQRRGIHLILKYLYKRIPSNIATIHINQLLSLLDNEHPSGRLNFPKGLIVARSYNLCTIAFEGKVELQPSFQYSLSVPGEVFVTEACSIKAEWINQLPEKVDGIDFFICAFEEIALPIHIRNRNPGDRMTLSGMKGTRKIKDIFIDQKIPKQHREHWPIVVDGNGQILWLPKLKKSALSINDQKNQYRNSHHYLLLQYISYNEEL